MYLVFIPKESSRLSFGIKPNECIDLVVPGLIDDVIDIAVKYIGYFWEAFSAKGSIVK